MLHYHVKYGKEEQGYQMWFLLLTTPKKNFKEVVVVVPTYNGRCSDAVAVDEAEEAEAGSRQDPDRVLQQSESRYFLLH